MKNKKWNKCSCGSDLLSTKSHEDLVYPCDKEKTVFNAYCNTSMSGCGRLVYAKNIEDLLIRWNNNITDETDDKSNFCCFFDVKETLYSINHNLYYNFPLRVFFDVDQKVICKHKKKV